MLAGKKFTEVMEADFTDAISGRSPFYGDISTRRYIAIDY